MKETENQIRDERQEKRNKTEIKEGERKMAEN
jgi:hypothetical protein